MNRSEFYSNLFAYQNKRPVDILSHALGDAGSKVLAKTQNGSDWGQGYYKKENINGKDRYFYTKEEYDAYIKNQQATQNAGADRAAKEKANQQAEANYNKNTGYEQNAGADRAAREKANREAAQVEATKQKMTNIVDEYNKSTGSKNGANEFNNAVKKLGLETEEGVQKYGGYDKALEAVKTEMDKSANNYNKNAQAAQNAGAARANNEKISNSNLSKAVSNVIKDTVKSEIKSTVADAVKDAMGSNKGGESEISKKNDQGRDAAIKNSGPSVKTESESERRSREEAERKARQEVEANKYYNESDLSKRNDAGRDAAMKNSGSSNFEVRHDQERLEQARKENNEGTRRAKEEEARKKAQAEKEEIEAARERNQAENKANAERSKANDSGRDAAIKNSSSSNKNNRIVEEASKKDADVKKIAEENGVSEEYVKELTYNTTGKSTGNNSKSTERKQEETETVDDEFAKAMGWDTGKKTESKSSNNMSAQEKQQKIIKDGLDKDADPKALASKYGVSEDYIKELLYNATGKIFHTAINPRFEFYDKLERYRENDELYHHGIIGQKWGVRRYQNPDGSLTEEGKKRYLNPDGSISNKAPAKIQSAYNRYKQAEFRRRYDSGELLQDDAVYSKDIQKQKLNRAKETDNYDMDFVEAIQNAYEEDGWDNHKDELNSEYAKYLKNPYKYTQEFDSEKWNKDHNDGKMNKEKIGSSEPKQEISENIEKTQNDLYKKKLNETLDKKGYITVEDMNRFNKEIESETGHKIKTGKEKAAEEKAAKKETKAAMKEAYKTASKSGSKLKRALLPPIASGISDWKLVNKAIQELGFTSAEQKNLSAADWNRINEKIKEMRK